MDDCASCSSGVFDENDEFAPPALPSETNDHTIGTLTSEVSERHLLLRIQINQFQFSFIKSKKTENDKIHMTSH